MSGIDVSLRLERDSDNSHPGWAGLEVVGETIEIRLRDPERTISFNLTRFQRAIAVLKDDEGSDAR